MKTQTILIAVAAFAAGWFCHTALAPAPAGIERVDTLRIIQPEVHAVRVREERRVRLPKAPQYQVIDTSAVTVDTLMPSVSDSVDVVLPIEEREYAGDGYRAVVSGYSPRLESLRIEQPAAPKNRRWSIGLQAGYDLTPAGAQPYIGVGISFKIL